MISEDTFGELEQLVQVENQHMEQVVLQLG